MVPTVHQKQFNILGLQHKQDQNHKKDLSLSSGDLLIKDKSDQSMSIDKSSTRKKVKS